MLARKEDAYLYDIPVPAEAAPAVQAEVPREPLLRHQLNTNLRNCLRAVSRHSRRRSSLSRRTNGSRSRSRS